MLTQQKKLHVLLVIILFLLLFVHTLVHHTHGVCLARCQVLLRPSLVTIHVTMHVVSGILLVHVLHVNFVHG